MSTGVRTETSSEETIVAGAKGNVGTVLVTWQVVSSSALLEMSLNALVSVSRVESVAKKGELSRTVESSAVRGSSDRTSPKEKFTGVISSGSP